MKKTLAVLAMITILILGGCRMLKSEPTKEEMIEVLKKEEVVEAIEVAIHNREEKALTEEGVIKRYSILYETAEWNPMGGINVDIILNNDTKLILNYTINKHNGRYRVGSSSASKEVSELLEKAYGN